MPILFRTLAELQAARDEFDRTYPVGTLVRVQRPGAPVPVEGQIVDTAFVDNLSNCVRVVVRLTVGAEDAFVVKVDQILDLNERPAPEASQTIEPKPRQPPEQFCGGRYAVDVDEGGHLRVLWHGVRQGIMQHHDLIGDMLTRIRDLRAELAEAKAQQTETPEPIGLSLSDICALLGWQGGTIHQVREEIVARRSVVERLASILYKVDEQGSAYVESLHGPVEAVVWAAKETLKKLERAIQTNRATRVFLRATDREVLEDAAARVVAERDDLRAQLAKTQQTETPAPEPEDQEALAILREVRDHQVHGHAIDPDDHVVVYCWSRGDVITNGLSPVVWHRNGETLAEATMHVANAGRRGADRYEVTTLRTYLKDCRARATAKDFSPVFAHRLTEPADTNPPPWPVPFAMPPVDSVMAPDLFFAARFDEIRGRAQRDLDRRAEEDAAPCDHTPWETARDGVVCKTCRVPMRFVGPGQGWEPVPGASAQVGESEDDKGP